MRQKRSEVRTRNTSALNPARRGVSRIVRRSQIVCESQPIWFGSHALRDERRYPSQLICVENEHESRVEPFMIARRYTYSLTLGPYQKADIHFMAPLDTRSFISSLTNSTTSSLNASKHSICGVCPHPSINLTLDRGARDEPSTECENGRTTSCFPWMKRIGQVDDLRRSRLRSQ